MRAAGCPPVNARSAQDSLAAMILFALTIATVVHTVLGLQQTEYLGVPLEPVLPVFVAVAVLEPLAHLVVAGGLLARWPWARIGGFVLAGMGLVLIVPTLATAAIVPESWMHSFGSETAAVASAIVSVIGVIGYLAVVLLLARSGTVADR